MLRWTRRCTSAVMREIRSGGGVPLDGRWVMFTAVWRGRRFVLSAALAGVYSNRTTPVSSRLLTAPSATVCSLSRGSCESGRWTHRRARGRPSGRFDPHYGVNSRSAVSGNRVSARAESRACSLGQSCSTRWGRRSARRLPGHRPLAAPRHGRDGRTRHNRAPD